MERTTSRDGTPIAYERLGDGPPLVLVSGALCDHTVTAPLAELLAPHFTVHNPDRRGRGASGDGPGPYAVEREIEDLAALTAEAGGSAAVCGFSSGAALALAAAADGGAGITALAVYEPPFSLDEGNRGPKAEYTARLTGLLADGRRSEALELFMAMVGLPPAAVGEMRGSPMWAGLEALAHTLAYDDAIVGDGTLPAGRLASVAVPTLVVSGGESWEWIRDSARAVADAVPGAEHRTLPGQTHEVELAVLAPVLTEFLTRALPV